MRQKHTYTSLQFRGKSQVLTCSEVNRVLLNTGTSGEEEKQKLSLQELEKENVWLIFLLFIILLSIRKMA